MTSNALFSDVVLPAATWYEKYDLSSTDLHPFVHTFNQVVPPWECKSDWDAFGRIAERFSELAADHLGVRRDVIAAPLMHDTADEIAQPFGEVRDWRAGECEPVPGKTMPKLIVVERDYSAVAQKWRALGPLAEQLGAAVKGASWKPVEEVAELRAANGAVRGGIADGRPRLETVQHACEAILMLSGTTNGRIATEGFRALERTTGVPLADLSEPCAGDRISFRDAQVQPRTVLTSPEWSGIEAHGRRYSPFTINVEREKPWHTLSGRMHFYVDHAWMLELGEGLPVFRPPLVQRAIFGDQGAGDGSGRRELTLKYLTPHSKWSIHSEYRTTCTCSRCSAALTELQGKRGGTDNSLTHIVMKPTHFIGGYGQLSYAFNYYGPTGSQRDEVTVLRKREAEVRFQ